MSGPGSRILLYRVKSCWGLQSLRIVCCFSGTSALQNEKSCADFRFKPAKLAILIIQLSSLDISIRSGKVAGAPDQMIQEVFEKDTRSYPMTRLSCITSLIRMITPGSYRPVIAQTQRVRSGGHARFSFINSLSPGGFAICK